MGVPKVLILQLKWFHFCAETFQINKISSFFEFPEILDISSFSSLSEKYTLQSVIIHSGSTLLGHYYCYAAHNNQWIQFDDHQVSPVSFSDVQKSGFGVRETPPAKRCKRSESGKPPRPSRMAMKLKGGNECCLMDETTSAYLLVYTQANEGKEREWKNDFPRKLLLEEMKKSVQQYFDNYGITIHVVSIHSLCEEEPTFSLLWDFVTPSGVSSYCVNGKQKLCEEFRRIGEKMGIPAGKQVWWRMREVDSVWRVDRRIPKEEQNQTFEEWGRFSRGTAKIMLYVQENAMEEDEILLFAGDMNRMNERVLNELNESNRMDESNQNSRMNESNESNESNELVEPNQMNESQKSCELNESSKPIEPINSATTKWREIRVNKNASISQLAQLLKIPLHGIWLVQNHTLHNIDSDPSMKNMSLNDAGFRDGDVLFLYNPAKELASLPHPFTQCFSVFCFPISKYPQYDSFIFPISGTDAIKSLKARIWKKFQESPPFPFSNPSFHTIPAVPKSWKDIRIFRFARPQESKNQNPIWKSYLNLFVPEGNAMRHEWLLSLIQESRRSGSFVDSFGGDEVDDETPVELALRWKPAEVSPSSSELFLMYDVIPNRNDEFEVIYVNLLMDHNYQEIPIQVCDDCTCKNVLDSIHRLPEWSEKELVCYCAADGWIRCVHALEDFVRYGCVAHHRSFLCVSEKKPCNQFEIQCEIAVLKGWANGFPVYSSEFIPRILPISLNSTYQRIMEDVSRVLQVKRVRDVYYLDAGESRTASREKWIRIERLEQTIRENPCDEKLFEPQDDEKSFPLFALDIS